MASNTEIFEVIITTSEQFALAQSILWKRWQESPEEFRPYEELTAADVEQLGKDSAQNLIDVLKELNGKE